MIHFAIPTTPSRECLDRYLADGLFRNGSVMARTPLVAIDRDVFGTVSVRARIAGARLRRSQRRMLRRNESRFRVVVGPARLDEAREELYATAKERFAGYMADTLESLLDCEPFNVLFDTREVAVYDEERLAAVSYFDLGRTSVASLLGLYDRRYARYGLGIYTMLTEVLYAVGKGYRYYYPGYVLMSNRRMDYKLRFDQMQYRSSSGEWRPLSGLPRSSDLRERIHRRIAALERELLARGFEPERRINPFFWLAKIDGLGEDVVGAPILLDCGAVDEDQHLVGEYLPNEDRYVIALVRRSDFIFSLLEGEPSAEMGDPVYLPRPLERVRRAWEGEEPAGAARIARMLCPVPIRSLGSGL